MATTDDTLNIAAALRAAIAGMADTRTRQLVAAWIRAWDEVAPEWQAAVEELATLNAAGGWPSRAQIDRASRAQQALAHARDRLDTLAAQAGVTVVDDAAQAAYTASAFQPTLIASQLPLTLGDGLASVAVRFDRVDRAALDAVVERTTGRVESTLRPLSSEAVEAMRRELVRGVAVGENPRRAAARMVSRVQGRFDGGLTRALTIARTEMLDASRAGAAVSQDANADVLRGWAWQSTRDSRACPACIALDGTEHPLEEPGPQGHPQCRCSRRPLTKSWRELGIAIDEPPSVHQTGREWFDGQPEAVQVQIMGRERLRRLRAGEVGWDDLVQWRENPDWRKSAQVRPVKDLPKRKRRRAA